MIVFLLPTRCLILIVILMIWNVTNGIFRLRSYFSTYFDWVGPAAEGGENMTSEEQQEVPLQAKSLKCDE